MNQQPSDNSTSNPTNYSGNGTQAHNSAPQEADLASIRQEPTRTTKRSLKRLVIILLAVGVAAGAVMSVGIALVLDRFELSDPPTQVDEPD